MFQGYLKGDGDPQEDVDQSGEKEVGKSQKEIQGTVLQYRANPVLS